MENASIMNAKKYKQLYATYDLANRIGITIKIKDQLVILWVIFSDL